MLDRPAGFTIGVWNVVCRCRGGILPPAWFFNVFLYLAGRSGLRPLRGVCEPAHHCRGCAPAHPVGDMAHAIVVRATGDGRPYESDAPCPCRGDRPRSPAVFSVGTKYRCRGRRPRRPA